MIAARWVVAALLALGNMPQGALTAACPDDPEVDLCDMTSTTLAPQVEASVASHGQTYSAFVLLLASLAGSRDAKAPVWALPLLLPLALNAWSADATPDPVHVGGSASTCLDLKNVYKQASCCGNPTSSSGFQVVPVPDIKLFTDTGNICKNKKPTHANVTAQDNYWLNINCMQGNVVKALEQAGANVTKGYVGGIDASTRPPITTSYLEAGLCPVNVHWHLGAEHLSVGQFDEHGVGPNHSAVEDASGAGDSRRLGVKARQGFRCHHYNKNDVKFTKKYNWQHCKSMDVGETYEIHWPHSGAGACGTPYQYQTPFYDGVFCKDGILSLAPLNTYLKIGVQSQTFTIVNDENYYYPDLIRGMIVEGGIAGYGKDIGAYTGSTTGTSRSNTICSQYTPITWQVDRKCHLISASSFDKMCADMKTQADDMSDDLHPHGARELVADNLASNNLRPR